VDNVVSVQNAKGPMRRVKDTNVELHRWDKRIEENKITESKFQSTFYPQQDSWYSFLLEAESTPGPYCGWKN
jgi:hypothetical protein